MKLNIKNRSDADAAINAFGRNQLEIKRLQDENRKLKALYEEWALAHLDEAFESKSMEGETETFSFAMAVGSPALKVQGHLDREDVIMKLEEDEGMAEYVIKTFDAEGIKSDFGGSASRRREIEDFGLYFTVPRPHLVVEVK